VKKNPFKGVRDEKPNYLIVTFFKDKRKELCTVLDRTAPGTPDFMRSLEREHGKALTTRTWSSWTDPQKDGLSVCFLRAAQNRH
jgi:hypothetical protein